MEINKIGKLAAALTLTLAAGLASAQNVKLTPLGTHTGELCGRDRAIVFEDPTGVRILYDAGQSLTGADDPRLGDVHIVLLTHAHSDHIGDTKLAETNGGTCDQPKLIPAGPNSITAEVIAAKNSAMMIVRELGLFVAKRVANIRGKPPAACAQTAGVTTVHACRTVPRRRRGRRHAKLQDRQCSARSRDHGRAGRTREQSASQHADRRRQGESRTGRVCART
jgi:hypothetical protein